MKDFSGAMNAVTSRHPACPGLPWESSSRSGEEEGPRVCLSSGSKFGLTSVHSRPKGSAFSVLTPWFLLLRLLFPNKGLLRAPSASPCLRGDIWFLVLFGFLGSTTFALAADSTKQAKLTIAPGGVVNISNNAGSVTLHQGNGHQVLATTTTHSDKVEVDANGTPDGKRVDIRAHALPQQKPTSDEAKVDCDITVPAGVSVTITTGTASITVDSVNADLSLSSDTGALTVRNASNTHINIRTVSGPVAVSNVTGAYLDVTSAGGAVHLTNVTGPRVQVGTTSANISYQGDFAGGGSYALTTHNGGIEVTLPEAASVDLTARSINGSVENDFPLQNKPHMTFSPTQGRSFSGTSNSGSSSVELESFSGKIRVKKQ